MTFRLPVPRFWWRRFGARLFVSGLCVSLVAACAEKENVLPGERFDPRDLEGVTAAAEALPAFEDLPEPAQPAKDLPVQTYQVIGPEDPVSLRLPQIENVSAWPMPNQNGNNLIPHAALRDGALTRVWSTAYGAGNALRQRVSVSPVATADRILTLDALMRVSAFGKDGTLLWQRDLTPVNEDSGEVTGGGLAIDGDAVFVTTGFGQLHKLDVGTGQTVWTHRFESAATAPPLPIGDLVYAITRDGSGWAIDQDTGQIVWQVEGTNSATNMLGSGAPSVAGRAVIFPFASGEIGAFLREAGISLWTGTLSGVRRGSAFGGIGGMPGGPIVAGSKVYASTTAGRMASFDSNTGERLWTAGEGTTGSILVAGNSLFFVSDNGTLVRMNASSGEIIWTALLPFHQIERISRRKDVYVHFGPILAGGRVIIASTDDLLREVDPTTGALLRETDLGAPAAAAPIVVDQTLYIPTGDGVLHAFR